MEQSPVPMAELEGAGHLVRYANPAFCRLTGKSKEALAGRPFAEAMQEGDTCLAALDRVYRTGEAETHTETEQPDPHPAYWSYAMWPVLDTEQRPAGVMMQVTETTLFHKQAGAVNEALLVSSVCQHELTEAAEDLNERLQIEIRERRRAEQHQQLLLNELAHRGKNLLAVIQTIVSRSLTGERSLAEARESLVQRIQALARSQTILVNGGFEGASLADVIRLEFAAFSDRVKAAGPELMLSPKATQMFALLVHELATNAIKHGALSQPGGRVAIDWSIENAATVFKFRWLERDGPPAAPPQHQGFGRILTERAAAQEFGVRPKISYAPEGLTYEINAPLSAVAAGAQVVELHGRT
jgi:PAS domain S-box-containing protein